MLSVYGDAEEVAMVTPTLEEERRVEEERAIRDNIPLPNRFNVEDLDEPVSDG